MKHLNDEIYNGHEISTYTDESRPMQYTARVRTDNYDGEQIYTATGESDEQAQLLAYGFIDGVHWAQQQINAQCNHGGQDEKN